MNELPEEIIIRIFSNLSAAELLVLRRVSSQALRLAEDDALWLRLCKRRWKGKQFHNVTKSVVERHHKEREAGRGKSWKVKYYEAEKDSLRTLITEEELCAINWQFSFLLGLQQIGRVRFDSDHRFLMRGADHMRWRITSDHCVQVQQYPPLRVSRTMDWGWTMRNMYVIFTSRGLESEEGSVQVRGQTGPVVVRMGNMNYIVMGHMDEHGQVTIDDEVIDAFRAVNAHDDGDESDEEMDDGSDEDEDDDALLDELDEPFDGANNYGHLF